MVVADTLENRQPVEEVEAGESEDAGITVVAGLVVVVAPDALGAENAGETVVRLGTDGKVAAVDYLVEGAFLTGGRLRVAVGEAAGGLRLEPLADLEGVIEGGLVFDHAWRVVGTEAVGGELLVVERIVEGLVLDADAFLEVADQVEVASVGDGVGEVRAIDEDLVVVEVRGVDGLGIEREERGLRCRQEGGGVVWQVGEIEQLRGAEVGRVQVVLVARQIDHRGSSQVGAVVHKGLGNTVPADVLGQRSGETLHAELHAPLGGQFHVEGDLPQLGPGGDALVVAF